MATFPAQYRIDQAQTIYFDPSKEDVSCGIQPVHLNKAERTNLRRRSSAFRRILNIDRSNDKWSSVFYDYRAKRCDPSTTKMLVMMLKSDDGKWPEQDPSGMQLVRLYIAFEVFGCGYEMLERSTGFQKAAEHLLFCQSPEEISLEEEAVYALVSGKLWPSQLGPRLIHLA